MHRDQVNLLRAHGIAMIGGSRQGLGAIDKLARWLRLRPALRAPAAGGPSVATVLNACKRATINEFDAKRLLAEHGIPVVQREACRLRRGGERGSAVDRLSGRAEGRVR